VKTCRNCALGKRLSSEHCDFRNYPSHPNWRPRRWVPVLICALVGLVLTIAMYIVIAVKDQERVDAIPRAEPVMYAYSQQEIIEQTEGEPDIFYTVYMLGFTDHHVEIVKIPMDIGVDGNARSKGE
jgi:hypothetical protein